MRLVSRFAATATVLAAAAMLAIGAAGIVAGASWSRAVLFLLGASWS